MTTIEEARLERCEGCAYNWDGGCIHPVSQAVLNGIVYAHKCKRVVTCPLGKPTSAVTGEEEQ